MAISVLFAELATRLRNEEHVSYVRLLGGGESTFLDVVIKSRSGFKNFGVEIFVKAQKLRLKLGVASEHILENEDLPVGAFSGPNADGGNRERLSYFFGKQARYAFENNAKNSEFLKLLGLRKQKIGSLCVATLNLESTELMIKLRRQTQMTHNGNA